MQISTQTLPKQQLQQMLTALHTLIADLRKPQEVATFFQDFLSDTEYVVLAKRLAIAQMLANGKSYEEIKGELKVSSATISSVSDLINKKGIQMALQKIKVDQWADNAATKISQWLSKR